MRHKITIPKHYPVTVQTSSDGKTIITYMKEIKKGQALYCSTPSSNFICFFDAIENGRVHYTAYLNLTANIFSTDDWFLHNYIQRNASQREINKLLHAIDKNGYIWDEATHTLKEKPDRTRVPENIGIFKLFFEEDTFNFGAGDGLLLGTENAHTVLYVGKNGYTVIDKQIFQYVKIPCRLVPCNYHDLEVGATAFRGGKYSDRYKQHYYVKKLTNGYIYLNKGSAIQSFNTDYKWYRVVPI